MENIAYFYPWKSGIDIHPMKELRHIYDRITYLRDSGVKMKDIAEATGFSPSVLSALYSTVLPSYFKNIEKGESEDDALDHALVWVNNVSKKKLFSSLPAMISALAAMDAGPGLAHKSSGNPLLSSIGQGMRDAVRFCTPYCGTYMSYSISSNCRKMKEEPYQIALSEDGLSVEVRHMSAYGILHRGGVMMNGSSHIYLCFNENPESRLALFYICLKVPMYDRPPILRGLYICLDYNYNPIARRIVFVRTSDSADLQEFSQSRGAMKAYDELDQTERKYYDYTCTDSDSLRMLNIPSPSMTEDDLALEKELLSQEHEQHGQSK